MLKLTSCGMILSLDPHENFAASTSSYTLLPVVRTLLLKGQIKIILPFATITWCKKGREMIDLSLF